MKKLISALLLSCILLSGCTFSSGRSSETTAAVSVTSSEISSVTYLDFGFDAVNAQEMYSGTVTSYSLSADGESGTLTVKIYPYSSSGTEEIVAKYTCSSSDLEKLVEIFESLDIYGWDGYKEIHPTEIPADNFTFDVSLSDGKKIYAKGYAAKPENFDDFAEKLADWASSLERVN